MGSDRLPEPLGSDNYGTWSLYMKALLVKKGLWNATNPAPTVGADGQPAEPVPVDPSQSDQAIALIMLNVKEEHLHTVANATSARIAWTALENIFKSKSAARLLHLRRALNTLKKEKNETLPQYVARAKVLRSDILAAGQQVSEEELASCLLNGLPKQYDTIVEVLSNTLSSLTLDSILPKLLDSEQRMKNSSKHPEDSGAFSARQYGRPSSDSSRNFQRSNTPSGQHSHNNNSTWCAYCKRKGHTIKNCFKKMNADKRAQQGPDHQSNSRSGLALSAVNSESTVYSHPNHWLLDSGASEHMTPDATLLMDYTKLDTPIKIMYGNGQSLSAVGRGTILLKTLSSRFPTVTVSNVLHVPDSAVNFLSMERLAAKQVKIMVDDGGAILVHKPTRELLFKAPSAPGHGYLIPALRPTFGPAAMAARVQENPELWHLRYGHLSYNSLAKLAKDNLVNGINVGAASFEAASKNVCDICETSKQTRKPFPTSESSSAHPLELVHMDLCGPMPVTSLGGSRYMATFLDDYSKLSVVRFVEHKSDLPEVVIATFKLMENLTDKKLKMVRTDRGSEYLNSTNDAFFKSKGIQHQTTAPYTPQQNGQAERLNRTIMERVRAMLQASKLPLNLWAEAANTACVIRNVSPASGQSKTPYELFWGTKPDVSQLRIFGCPAYVHVPKDLRHKLEPVAIKGIFVGYQPGSKAYRVLVDGKIKVSRDVTFNEAAITQPTQHDSSDSDSDTESDDDGENHDENMPDPSPPLTRQRSSSSSNNQSEQQQRYPKRQRQAPLEYWRNEQRVTANSAQTEDIPEPSTYKEALSSNQAELWKHAMDEEYTSLMTNNTWELVPLPDGCKAIPAKWVYKIKRNADGSVERFKARLVAKGFMQREGIDFNEVFAPVSKHTTLRLLLAKAAYEDLEIIHLDIKTAFLNGDLEETIYMQQPEGYVSDPRLVCRLRKSLYGLRQAPRAWFKKLKETLEATGFTASQADASLYIKIIDGKPVYVLVYVDDILAIGTSAAVGEVKATLKASFDVRDLGDVSLFLGMHITRDRSARTIKINQSRMISELLTEYNMRDAKPKSIPISPSIKLVKTEPGDELDTSTHPFRELVGSLLYLTVCTRPDIAFAVGALARYMSKPSTEHWNTAKGILRYLAGTPDYGINFGGSNNIDVVGYCDSDYAGDISTRRSTTGYVFLCNNGAISWSSRLQPTVAASTCEAEYMSAASAVKEALWLRTLLLELGNPSGALNIYADNQGALKLLKNPIASARSKHIDVMHHFTRDRVARGEVNFVYESTDKMLADILTKPVPEAKFSEHRMNMGIA